MNALWISVLALVCVAGVVHSFGTDAAQDDNGLWEMFKKTYERTYESAEEEEKRRSIFMNTVERVREHNQLFENGQVSYTVEINQFADKLRDEVPKGLASMEEDMVICDKNVHEPEPHLRVPSSFDWRTKGAVTPVKNQKDCESCWAFSATGALEGQHAIKSKKLVSLSEQDLMDCDKYDGHCMGGGFPWTAFKYISQHGIESETAYPYEDKADKCRFNKKKIAATDKGCKLVTQNENAVKKAVATIGPISIGIDASPDSFIKYSGGIYDSNDCSSDPNAADHAVLIVGYGTDNGKDYWLVKNSWGENWGEKGYIRIARGHNRCGVANYPTYPIV